jgi:predicted DNA-binding protein with PD1-like motif
MMNDGSSSALLGKVPMKTSRYRSFVSALLGLVIVATAISGIALYVAVSALAESESTPTDIVRSHSLRLLPGQDLTSGIMKVVNDKQLKAAWIISCVGSLDQFSIRYANQPGIDVGQGHFEIVSLVGTMTVIDATPDPGSTIAGAWHIHISIGDGTGKTISGHLATNSTIYTTAEIQIGYSCNVEYSRAVDGTTPWDELQISPKTWC